MTQCKMVMVVMGEDSSCLEEVRIGVRMNLPIVLVKGSLLCDRLISGISGKEPIDDGELASVLNKGHFYVLETEDSEDLANMANFFFTVTPF